MTTQTQTIIFCVMGAVAVPLGTFVAIKCIKKIWLTPENVLYRRGDIELNYIEPTQPGHVYQPIDLLQQAHIDWRERAPSYFSEQIPPSYQSGGIPPSYHSTNGYYINSSLENENIINYDFIFWLILFILIYIIIIIILNYKIELILPSNLENKITTFLFNNKYFLKRAKEQNVNLENFNLRKTIIKNINSVLIRIILVGLLILYLLYWYNIFYSYYVMSILIPFSYFEIDFRDSFEWKVDSYRNKPKISYFKIQTLTKDIESLLNSLKDDVNYSMSLSFISSYNQWKENKKKIVPFFIDDAIIVNKESDPILITQFIMNKLDDKSFFLINSLFEDMSINLKDPFILTVILPIKVEI